MGSVQLDKTEWEAFLEKLAELERKYLQVLRELDQAHARLNGLVNQPKEPETPKEAETTSTENVARKSEESSQKSPPKAGGGLLAWLKTELASVRNLNALQQVACSRCGRRLTHASRFCEKCGADFGKLICACGRELSPSDKFCDRCARPTTQTTKES